MANENVTITIDERRQGQAISQAQRDLGGLSNAMTGATRASTALTTAQQTLSNTAALIPGPVGRAAQSLSTMTSAMASANTTSAALAIGLAAAAAGVVALGVAMFGAARSAANFQEQMDILADRTGLSTSELYGLKVAAQESGRSFEEIQPALDFFTRKVGEVARGNEEATAAFARLGVTVRDSNGEIRPTGELLQEVGGRLRGITSSSERAAAAFDFFGRSGARTLDVLAGKWEAVNAVSKETEAQLQELDRSFDRLGTSIEGARIALLSIIGVSVLPWVKALEGLVAQFERLAGIEAKVGGGFGDVRREERGSTFAPLGPPAPDENSWAVIRYHAEKRAEAEKKSADEMQRQLAALNSFAGSPFPGPPSDEFFARQRNPFLDQRSTELLQRPQGDIAGTSVAISFSEAEKATRAYQEALADVTGVTENATKGTREYVDLLVTGISSFFVSAIKGVDDLGAAFRDMILDVLARAATKGLLSLIPGIGGFLQEGGTPLRAQGGMLISGIRGRDTVPVLAGRGETIISHHLTDQLSMFLMNQQRGGNQRPAAPPVNVTLNFQSNVIDRVQLKQWLDEEAVPLIRRSVATGSARAY